MRRKCGSGLPLAAHYVARLRIVDS